MKKISVLLVFALITGASFGQSNYQDVVYLKNGSIIRGIIIEQIPNKSIKIETVGRNIFHFEIEEIEKLAREPVQGRSAPAREGNVLPGYTGIFETGIEIGTGPYGMDRLKVSIINGYQVNQYFSLGFGTGLRYYFDAEAALVPVFADFRANFPGYDISPYMSLGTGYTFNASRDFRSIGFLLNPTAGISIMVSEKSALNVGIGYEMQRMKFYNLFWGGIQTKNSGAISINAGISF
jgi:hypothetical protein